MSTGHRFLTDYGKAISAGGDYVIAPPSSGGTFAQRGLAFGTSTVGAGTYILPNNGLPMYVRATGAVTITSAAPVTVATLASGEAALCIPLTATTWAATVFTAGAIEINTAADVPIADAGGYTATTEVEGLTQVLLARTAPKANTAISTVGNGTLTAASIVGGLITRSGSTAAYTDTTVDAAAIFAALGTAITGSDGASWILAIKNTVAFPETIAGGTNVNISGQSIVPPNSTGLFLVATNGSDQIDIVGFGTVPQAHLPQTKFTTSSTVTSLTYAAGDITGAKHVYWQNTADGAVAATTRTATQMFGDIPNAHIGLSFQLTIVNRGDNTVTFTAGTGVTITGEATIATLTTRTYHATFTSATAVTFTSVNKGTIET